MKTPLLLLGASLIFWGWQTGLLLLAVIMALILEGSRLVRSRLDLSPTDFIRISDLSALVFVGMVIYLYAQNRSAQAILAMLQWLPLILLPLLAAQAYSTSEKIHIGAFFWTFRKRKREKGAEQRSSVNITYPYLVLCILSASAANARTPWFYVGLFFLSVWALWSVRSKRFSPVLWISLLVFIGIAGYVGHMALNNLQIILEKKTLEWFAGFLGTDSDPYRSRTAIGDIGALKLSDRIVFRVKPELGHKQPMLLREASYNAYKSSAWFAMHAHFKPVQPERDRTTWELRPGQAEGRIITISQHLRRGKGILKLPNGSFEIARLPVFKMAKNQFGAVKVEEGPGLINYGVRFNAYTSLDAPPNENDLSVPQRERVAISRVIQGMDLTRKSPQEILKSVSYFFQKNFKYSLIQDTEGYSPTPLGDFLLRSRSGHCEYFATASVLLLRAAGIPARYATGYSVQEFSKLETRFIVRSRHAHAWTLAYVDGLWQDFDTTPSSWVSMEEDASSFLEPLYDLWSWSLFKFSQWRWREKEGGIAKYIWWLLIPLGLLLAWRLYSKSGVRHLKRRQEETGKVEVKPGKNSEFYLIEKRLIESGNERHPWETLSSWIKRIDENQYPPASTETLHDILALHYRYRFDPKGITNAERSALNSKVRSWLAQHEENRNPHAEATQNSAP